MLPRTLGHYRIDEQLGAGGMGVVYKAHDTRLHRTVAIKELQNAPPELAVAQLLHEARAASTLNHPNICAVHDVGEIDGHAFIVMEYVAGKSLSAAIRENGLAVQTVLDYGMQIADAVSFAHANGVIHRDLKSSNIVITPEGRAKVLDFGLSQRMPTARADEVTESPTVSSYESGDTAGTLAYMSPEALRGLPADPRSDVWSIGIVLYEMATGHRPYEGRTAFDLAASVLSEEPVSVPATLPPPLAAVINRCLAKQPGRRYRQAGEVRAALEAVQLTNGRSEPSWLPRKPTVERRAMIAAAAVAIILATSLFGIKPLRDIVGQPAIAFSERDWLLVTDFDNQTGDGIFDRSLDAALSAALTQSRYVNVVPPNRIRETLRRMEKSNVARTNAAIGREIAVREGFELVLAPTITSTGDTYLLAASLIDPTTGAALKSETVRVGSKDDVLGALDELSSRVRNALGEERAIIESQTKPLLKATTSSLQALQLFTLGREAHASQQFAKARSLYEEALRIDPSFTSARASLGILNVEFFDRAKGLELLSQAVKAVDGLTDNERVSVLGFYAMAVENDLEKAADHYRAYLAVHPDSSSAHNNLGRIYMQRRRWTDAVAELREAIRLDPDLFLAYFSLNSIYLYEVADLDAAIELAQRQLSRDPRSARAYAQLGAAYAGKNDLRQAESALRQALQLDPDQRYSIDRYRLGHVLRLQGRYDEARRTYLEILDLAPKEISAYYEAGAVSQLIGDEGAAHKYLRSVITESERRLQANPRDGERQLELASAYGRMGNTARAEEVARRAAAFTTDLHVERAGLLVVLGRREEALDTLARAVDDGYSNSVWMRIATDLHALQGDARLEQILAKLTQ